jgi:hypothetical protein
MAKKFLSSLKIVNLPSDPISGSEGELYFNSSASVAKIYQAGAWSVLGAGAGGGTTVSTTEPESPEIGDSWYKNDTGEFYVYDGTYWVEVNGVIASESFKTISVSGQSDVVADSNTDTLTLVAGTNVSITTNSTNDSITINADSKSTSSVYLVRNNTGSTILKGTLVSASGAEPSGRIDVEPFAAVGGINSELTVMGMATANISNGVNGEVISFGTLTGLDTRGNVASGIAVGDETWAAGDILFAHPTVAGKLTKVRPQHDLAVAFITVSHASTGQIAVRIFPGNNHLEWMHDVLISGSVQNNEILSYDLSNGLWINKTADEAGIATTSDLSNYLTTSSASTNYATKTYADSAASSASAAAVSYLIDSAPSTLDTLNELAAALGDDSNFASTVTTSLSNKLDISTASSTYLTQVNASTIYATSSHNHTLDSLSDVSASTSLDNQTLKYDITSGTWENKFIDSVEFLGYNSGSASIPAFTAVRSVDNFDGQYPEIINIDLQSIAAIGITSASVAGNSFGKVVTFGILNNVDTSEFIDGDILYVSDTNGSLATTRPTSGNVQIIARVIKGESVDGIVHVFNSSQEFNLPNLTQNKIWMGDAANYPSEQVLSTTIIPEGSNLYFTNQRAIDATISTISSASTSAVSYTNSQINLLTTTDIEEGNNLYFTNQRAVAAGSATYLTQVNASTVYQQKTPNLTELSLISGSSGFLKTDGFENWSIDSNTYLTTETDPVFTSSDAYSITSASTSAWNTAYGWGDHSLAGYSLTSHNHTLDSLTNVDINSLNDGDAIIWSSASSAWINQVASGGATTTVSDTAPATPTTGDSWYKPSNGSFFIYDGSYWIEVTSIITMSDEEAQDKIAPLFNHANHINMSASYNDATNQIILSAGSADTLSSVTSRGATTSNAITISNTTEATNATTGALIVSGGVGVAKDLWIDGNLHVAGTTTTENTKTVETHDNLIYLNASLDSTITNAVYSSGSIIYTADNLYVAEMDIRITGVSPSAFNISSEDLLTVASATPTQFVVIKSDPGASYISGGTAHAKEGANPDLGFAGGYYDAGYAHAGLFRDASDGVFKFFQGYTPEPNEAVNIDTTHASFAFADIQIRNIKPQGSGQNDNFGIGYNATLNATGFANFGIGQNAFSDGSGTNNFAFGDNSMENNTGGGNFAFGVAALTDNTGNYNYGIGYNALQNNSGWDNYSIGPALYGNTGDWNYAVGTNSLQSNTGDYNFAFGYQAGLNNTGSYNVYIGKSEGLSTSNNIIIADNEGNIRAQYLSASSGWTIDGATTLSGDLAINGGDLTTSQTTINLFNGANTVNLGTNSSFVNIGKSVVSSGVVNINGTVNMQEIVSGYATIDDLILTNPLSYEYGGTGLTTLGTAGQALVVNAGATGLEWATPSGGGGGPTTTTTSITVNTAISIESFAIATSRTAEAIIQITQGTDYYSSKILLIHDGTTVKMTEYAILESTVGAIPVTISSAISGSNVELRATITDAATTSATAKVVMTEVAV